VQQLPAAREAHGAVAVGKQAVVTDAHEAARDDVEQKAAQKLGRVDAHLFDDAARRVVFVAEADLVVGDAEDALVGDGDPMRVAGEVFSMVVTLTYRCDPTQPNQQKFGE